MDVHFCETFGQLIVVSAAVPTKELAPSDRFPRLRAGGQGFGVCVAGGRAGIGGWIPVGEQLGLHFI